MSKTNKDRRFRLILWGSALVAAYFRLAEPDLTWFNTHMSRDLARAFEWLDLRPYSLLGPEMNHGHRLPGPAFYFILGGAWSLFGSITGVLTALHLLTIGLGLVFTVRVVRPLGRVAALVFWLLFILMPTQVLLCRTMWNPSLVVAINLGYLLCLDHYRQHRKPGALVAFYLLGAVGIQLHLSTLLGLVAGTLWLRLQVGRWPPLSLLGIGSVMTYWAAIWGLTDGYAAYFQAVQKQYVFLGWGAWESTEFHWGVFLHSVYYHLFITLQPLGDYELYSLVLQFGPALLPQYPWIERFALLGSVWVACLAACLFYLAVREAQRRAHPLEQLLLLWLAVGLVVLYCYRIKDGIFPYRYGMTFYPLQFLLPALALKALNNSKVSLGALFFAAVVFAGNAFFLTQNYRLMKETARASQSPAVCFEMALRHKLHLLEKVDVTQPPHKIFATLHGGVANRVRTFEFDNWDQRRWTGGLCQSLIRTGRDKTPSDDRHYRVRFPVQGESELDYEPVEEADLPEGVVLTYFDRGQKAVGQAFFLSKGELILAVLQAPPSTRFLEVEFRLSASPQTWVEAWFDGHVHHRVLELERVWIDEFEVESRTESFGWLDQHRATFEAGSGEVACRMRFKVYRTESFSRLDIFRSSSIAGTP